MTEVIMMCGVCGSGKTTFAKQKEREGYIRLSIDETMWKMYGQCGWTIRQTSMIPCQIRWRNSCVIKQSNLFGRERSS